MWYVLQVKAQEELNVKNELKKIGYTSCVPRENRLIRQGGKWNEKEYILIPSYVFVELKYNAENYYKIKGMANVIRFLPTCSSPTPLTYLEAEWIKLLGNKDEAIKPTEVLIENDCAKIVNGVLDNFNIIKIDKHKKKATFKITVCGEDKFLDLSVKILNEADIDLAIDSSC